MQHEKRREGCECLMHMPDDRQLLALIAVGNQEAMECLYARYRLRLWRYLWYRLQGDAARVEETLQEVFLSVWRSAHTYRGEARVETWIQRIAQHIVANACRSHARHAEGYLQPRSTREQPETEQEELAGESQPSHEDHVLERITLLTALRQLSPQHREVLELAFYYGFSCEEIAQIVNVPTGTVKSRISNARKKLQEVLRVANATGGDGL